MKPDADMLYLAIDAGNTRVKFGVFELANEALPHCLSLGFVMCGQALPATLLGEIPPGRPVRVVLSGSNPPEIARLSGSWPAEWPSVDVLRDRARLPIAINVDAPEKVGLDRLLNAVAVQRIRKPGQPVVIVDSGTATTVDYVDATGAFRGGAILAGIGMSARALHDYTALLPLIPAPDVTAAPPDVIGPNTIAAMKSGLFWGHVGAVRELSRQMLQRDPDSQSPLLITTGGAGAALAPYLPDAQIQLHLPLQGLVITMSS